MDELTLVLCWKRERTENLSITGVVLAKGFPDDQVRDCNFLSRY